MKKLVNLLSMGTILLSSPIVSNITGLQQVKASQNTYINDRVQTTIKNQEVDEKYLSDYTIYQVSDIVVDVTTAIGLKETGDFSKLFKSVALDNFKGEIYNFTWRKPVTNLTVNINNIPDNAREWQGPMIEIESSYEWSGKAYIEGKIYGQLKLTRSSLDHLILHFLIFVSGISWCTGNWAHVWFKTGDILSLVKKDDL